MLRSIVDATVTLFQAHAASIALYDAGTNQLVFRVAAGEQGSGVLGLSINTDQGLAGYVFSTAQAIAISDVKNDARFGRAFAERTGYVPTSIVAVPLVDEESTPVRPWHPIQGPGDASTMWYVVMRKQDKGIFMGQLTVRHTEQQAFLEERGWQEVPIDDIGVVPGSGAPVESAG